MPRIHSIKRTLLLAISGLIVGSGLVICSLVAYRYTQALYAAAATHAAKISSIRSRFKRPIKS